MIDRTILVVDDDEKVKTLSLPLYEKIAREMREENEKYSEYELHFLYAKSIDEAKELLSNRQIVIDVLLIDYMFIGSGKLTGVDLIEIIRKEINKHCRLILFTMHSISDIDYRALLSLIDNQVYKVVDKSIDDCELLRVLYDAAVSCDYIVCALERFWKDYDQILSSSRYTIVGQEISFPELIAHIRMDDDIGRIIVDKLLRKALLESIER